MLGASGWVEPMRNWIQQANHLRKVSVEDDLHAKKIATQKIFGSNLVLKTKIINQTNSRTSSSRLETQWNALRAARQKTRENPKSLEMAGTEGFEPPNAWTKTRCLTTWPRPIARVR